MRLFALILSIGLLLSPLFAKTAELRSGKEAYADEETGISFPAEMAGLRKNEVVKNFNPLIGTVIRYSDAQGTCADIYLYTLSSNDRYLLKEDLETHFRSLIRSILTLPERTTLVKDVRLLGDQQITDLPNPAWRACFQITQTGGKPNSSWLVLSSVRRHVIKLRFTPAGSGNGNQHFQSFEKALLALCSPKEK